MIAIIKYSFRDTQVLILRMEFETDEQFQDMMPKNEAVIHGMELTNKHLTISYNQGEFDAFYCEFKKRMALKWLSLI